MLNESRVVINELSYFANITLSSFYFDINKDCLYAERENGIERRRVLTVLDQVRYRLASAQLLFI